VARHKGGPGRYPGISIRPGTERDVLTVKTYKFNADDAQQRLLWATVIESLMKQHGYIRTTNCKTFHHSAHITILARSLVARSWHCNFQLPCCDSSCATVDVTCKLS
jgi:hypothetical protein